jgi:chromosome segregation ATPase
MTLLRLTYDELGERIGRSVEAARGLARRRRWRIEKGNDGRTRVLVDERELDGWRTDVQPVASGHERSRPDGRERSAELQERLAKLEAERERLARELLQAVERAALAEGRLATAGETTDALRDALADLSRRLDRAEERLAQPWWRKLLG